MQPLKIQLQQSHDIGFCHCDWWEIWPDYVHGSSNGE